MSKEDVRSIKIAASVIVAVVLTVFAFYLSYRSSQRAGSSIVLPAGSTYVGPTI